jgi:hypothetical protein
MCRGDISLLQMSRLAVASFFEIISKIMRETVTSCLNNPVLMLNTHVPQSHGSCKHVHEYLTANINISSNLYLCQVVQ